jgi:hypothetical protein
MAAEVELADFKAAASTEMGRARSLHETLTAQLEAAAAELTSREGAAVGLTARLAAAAEEAQAQRGAVRPAPHSSGWSVVELGRLLASIRYYSGMSGTAESFQTALGGYVYVHHASRPACLRTPTHRTPPS